VSGNAQGAFRALADPTRRQIMVHLRTRDMTIGEVVDRFDITRAAIKKHLDALESGGLITVHKHGRERINRLEPEGLRTVLDWLDHFSRFWDDRLADLKAAIDDEKGERT